MRGRTPFFGGLAVLFGSGGVIAVAQPAATVMPPSGAEATFVYTTSVQTPKGKHSGSGTISVRHTHGRSVTLTVKTDDGTTKTIPLLIGMDGSVAPDPAAPAPAATTASDAAARAFMSDVSLAAHVGMAARKNAPASSFDVPVKLTPIGDGTPVPSTLRMTGTSNAANSAYAGSASGATMTKLPPSSGLDPAMLAKTVGVGTVAHFAFGPAGRIATAVAMHRKTKEQKKAAAGVLPDSINVAVTTHLADGRFHSVSGTQDDVVTIGSKKTTIVSTWSFTKEGP